MGICSAFRQKFKEKLANDLLSQFKLSSPDVWFLSIGKNTPWTDSDTGEENDAVPNKNVDSPGEDTDFWRQCFAHRRLVPSDISLVIARYDWQPGQVYDAYRNDVDLYDDTTPSKFYVLVDESRVYKCIDNNYSSPSTESPTHTDSQIRTLSDGYRWKFLYQIPESKRKFLTKTSDNNQGYMPVEYVEFLNDNDERILQWYVQQSAVPGSIDHIEISEQYVDKVISDRVLFPDSSNAVIAATGAGSSTVIVGGSRIVPENDYYNGMVFRIEYGLGAGQQRVISDYTYNSNGTALVTLNNPLNIAVTGGTGSDASLFSILPRVEIIGDGHSNSNTFNTYYDAAELNVKFSTESISGSSAKYVESIEVANSGRDYTIADVVVYSGLTHYNTSVNDFSDYATAILGYPGGNGSNAVKELGCAGIMIVADFSQSENDKITVQNDYRQFALTKNLELLDPKYRLYFNQAGVSGSFTVGASITQGTTGPGGIVLSWTPGTSGVTGTSELVVEQVFGGDFAPNNSIAGFTIFDCEKIEYAGKESRILTGLKMTPLGSTGAVFDPSGYDYIPQYVAVGVGNTANSVPRSNATGRIYRWSPDAGTNASGTLYLENSTQFTIGENVSQITKQLQAVQTPKGKIYAIEETIEDNQEIYDQVTELRLNYDGTNTFEDESFVFDAKVQVYGATASGYVLDWIAASGGTYGNLFLTNVFQSFAESDQIKYAKGTTSTYLSTISEIVSLPDVKYRVGDIAHIQNIRPVERSFEQKEEIKLLIEF